MDIGRQMEEIVVADPRELRLATDLATPVADLDELELERDLGGHHASTAA